MKKLLLLPVVLLLISCANNESRYQETGLLCEDAEHNSGEAQITLDVDATKEIANVVVNGERVVLKSEGQKDPTYISYYGANAAGEQIKLDIIFTDNEKSVQYMLGINSDESTYGCFKK